jgi:hypothetical protein
MEPIEHIIYEGILSDVPVGRLERGESREVDITICFLSYGRFEIGAEVQGLGVSGRAGVGQLTADVHQLNYRQ